MVLDRFGVVIDWVRKKRQTNSWETIGRMLHNDDFVEEMSGGEWPEDTREHIDEILEHSRRLEIEEQYFDRFTDHCRSSDISSNDVLKDLGDRGFQNFLESCRSKERSLMTRCPKGSCTAKIPTIRTLPCLERYPWLRTSVGTCS